eukprot:gene19969-21924_t
MPDEKHEGTGTLTVKEVGPYVYRFSSKKEAIVFSDKGNTVSYKSLTNTLFDPSATKDACPTCSENDQIVTVNAAYIGMMMRAGGDKKFALGPIPGTVQRLLAMAKTYTGYANKTLEKFGSFSDEIFPSNHPMFPSGWLPAGFGRWLYLQNRTAGSIFHGIVQLSNRTNFTLSEMKAVYDVISSPTALGTIPNATLRAQCIANPTISGCGYLFYLNVYQARMRAGLNSSDPVAQAVFAKVKNLFCPDANKCIEVSPLIFKAICEYITNHLAKLAIHLVIDSIDFGPVMKRSVKQLTKGFTETRLKIPGIFPTGVPIPGYLPSHSINDVGKIKPQKFFTCKSASKPFQWAGYNGSKLVSAEVFPLASNEFRNIRGGNAMFGLRNSFASCTCKQPPTKSWYTIFDPSLSMKATIKNTGAASLRNAYLNKYMLDTKNLLKVNNISVFFGGLIDHSSMGKSFPKIISMPHFLDADAELIRRFGTKPSAKKHGTIYLVEPITGAAMKVCKRIQYNYALPEAMVAAPRQKQFNITYKEKTGAKHYTKVIPVFWLSVDATAGNNSLDGISQICPVLQGACASIILGPLIGGLMIIIGIIYLIRSSKTQVGSE